MNLMFENSQQFLSEASVILAGSLNYAVTLQKVADLAKIQFSGWCSVFILQPDQTIEAAVTSHRDAALAEEGSAVHRVYPRNRPTSYGAHHAIHTRKSTLIKNITNEQLAEAAQDQEHYQMLVKKGFKSYISVPLIAHERVLGAITFITDERTFDEEDLKLAQELARRAASAIDNACLYEKAREVIASRDRLFCITSHELRNPLTALRSSLELARRTGERETLLKALDHATRSTDRLSRLVDDMFNLSQIKRSTLELNVSKTNVAGLIAELIDSHKAFVAGSQCELRIDVDPGLEGVWDRSRILQIFENLLTNALKYAAGKPIDIRAKSLDGNAIIEIADQGPGIPRELRDTIFDVFVRGNRDGKIAGLGMGLFIVKQLLMAHQGSIRIESGEGCGARFIICLPLQTQ